MGYPDPETQYERAIGPDIAGNKGPLRFEEGVATDTDVPNEFGRGAFGDTQGDARGRPYTIRKTPEETMRERAHVGSASWIEAPEVLSEFVWGVNSDVPEFQRVQGSEQRYALNNPTRVG